MPLLESLQDGHVPFEWINEEGEPLIKGERWTDVEDEEWAQLKAEYYAHNPITADVTELLAQRDRLRKMILKRLKAWDLEWMAPVLDAKGEPVLDADNKPQKKREYIPLTLEGITAAKVKDDFLGRFLKFLNEDRTPNQMSESS